MKSFPKTMIRAKGGGKERRVRISSLVVPDMFRISEAVKNTCSRRMALDILECWHLSIDMWRHLQELAYGSCEEFHNRKLRAMNRTARKQDQATKHVSEKA